MTAYRPDLLDTVLGRVDVTVRIALDLPVRPSADMEAGRRGLCPFVDVSLSKRVAEGNCLDLTGIRLCKYFIRLFRLVNMITFGQSGECLTLQVLVPVFFEAFNSLGNGMMVLHPCFGVSVPAKEGLGSLLNNYFHIHQFDITIICKVHKYSRFNQNKLSGR